MTPDLVWQKGFALDVEYGFLGHKVAAPQRHHPKVVLNNASGTVLRELREQLRVSHDFTFSVAFVAPRAIALLKQELLDFHGDGRIVTSDYLGFNSPAAFAELLNLRSLGIDVRLHEAVAFHPKCYVFKGGESVTALVGSANLTHTALVTNHEWNLRVTAAIGSDLERQLTSGIEAELEGSRPLTQEWLDAYSEAYVPPPRSASAKARMDWRHVHVSQPVSIFVPEVDGRPELHLVDDQDARARADSEDVIIPNAMQYEALAALADVRSEGKPRAIIISATGTGKTMLSALDVRAVDPERLLFVVHREQILDRTISEYQRVLGGDARDFGKLTGTTRQPNARFLFATVQTLSKPDVLESFAAEDFDYIIVDEAHRAASASHRRVLDHFDPKFLLGMTATPERLDGFNVFELFDFVVPYEIRLNDALEADLLSPFHYYGVTDVTLADGNLAEDPAYVAKLSSAERVAHIVKSIETYGQAGVQPRGLMFCSRTDEARSLSAALNARTLRGVPLRTAVLTGNDSVEHREAIARQLEAGELDYILSVDIFNEGVDIPTVNQVVLLRETQSPIVFVQQLGRGLRKAVDKDYLVVIDFIGNYANNFMIPIALFGDESLNKESLRKNLIAAEEIGVLASVSSVRFDRIAQERILKSIVDTKLDSMQRLRIAVESMRNRVGGVPTLWDFHRFGSVDPVLLATKKEHFPALIASLLRVDADLSEREGRALGLLSHEVLTSKRPHEAVLLEALLRSGQMAVPEVAACLKTAGLLADARVIESVIDTFTLAGFAEADINRYRSGVARRLEDGSVAIVDEVMDAYSASGRFTAEVDDMIRTALAIAGSSTSDDSPFAVGRQYSRKEVTRLLCMPRKWTSTLYGYKVDSERGVCPIFVTLHKSDDVAASTAYGDELVDERTMIWFTRSRRTLRSGEVRAIAGNEVALHVFVKKDDAEGSDFYYLGRADSRDAEQTTMLSDDGLPLDVVRMRLHFEEPIEAALIDYFHPVVTG